MELLIFRHGPAGDPKAWKKKGRPDEERPLTPAGKAKTGKAAAGLAALVDGLDFVASSPLRRAVQTADALAKKFKRAERLSLEALEPGADPDDAIAALASHADGDRVAFVGHEPHLSALVGALIGAEGARLDLKKAGACLLDVGKPKRGGATLRWLLTPSQLRALR